MSFDGPGNISVLMTDTPLGEGISTGVLSKLGAQGEPFKADKGTDIEKVISLLTASGIEEHLALAEEMRKHYFAEVCARLVAAIPVKKPSLAIALLEMHSNASFRNNDESLSGVITTNHDGLLQAAFMDVFKAVDVGFPFDSNDIAMPNGGSLPPLLQLHGSFTWGFGIPLAITLLSDTLAYSADASWIPPTVLKESKSYPFNKLIATAYELLTKRCDLLRIVGSSLTQNDWNILSLIFNAQRHNMLLGTEPFPIHLIMPQKDGLAIRDSSTYLKNVLPIASIQDGGNFKPYEKFDTDYPAVGDDEANPFYYWLKEKIIFHETKKSFGTSPLSAAMSKVAGGVP